MIREDVATTDAAAPTGVEYNPITVTPSAAEALRTIMAEKELTNASLRVFVSGGGCSGLQYGMTFEVEPQADDLQFESSDLHVVVDPISVQYLHGCNIDFEDSLMGGGFKIDNPNAVSSCGCGSSFRTTDDEGASHGGHGGCHC